MYAVRSGKYCFNPASNNTGIPYKLSRTRIDNFLKCRRCFWLEERYGIKKPDSFPLTLNIAVDALMKKEFDVHRVAQTSHPMMKSYGIDAVPFANPQIDVWRENFVGVQCHHKPTNLLIFGAVDDVWKNSQGELQVVDYKATAKATAPALDGSLGVQYKRQMEVYQWLIRQNGFTVSDVGYFVYVNGKKDAVAFDAKLEFDVSILPCEGDASWIEPTLVDAKACLMAETTPASGEWCEHCAYREVAGRQLQKIALAERAGKMAKTEAPKIAPTPSKKKIETQVELLLNKSLF